MSLSADNFRADWYGYVTNQAGHAYLIGFPLGWMFGDLGPAVVFAVYLVVWELVIQHGRNLADSLEDAAHVTLGAAVFMAATGAIDWGPWPYAMQVSMLVFGSWLRIKNAKRL